MLNRIQPPPTAPQRRDEGVRLARYREALTSDQKKIVEELIAHLRVSGRPQRVVTVRLFSLASGADKRNLRELDRHLESMFKQAHLIITGDPSASWAEFERLGELAATAAGAVQHQDIRFGRFMEKMLPYFPDHGALAERILYG